MLTSSSDGNGAMLTVLVALSLSFPSGGSDEPFLDLSFDAALKKAGDEKKLVMIDFFTTWCPPCKQLDKTTWTDDGVKRWLAEHTVALKINAEKEEKLAERFKIDAYPTILFAKPDGVEVARIVGYRPPTAFLEEADGIRTGRTPLVVAEERAASQPQDIKARLDRGRERMRADKKAEALEDFLFVFDESPTLEPSYTGVRLSYLLADIVRLGAKYPPAMDALRTRRDAALKALVQPGEVNALLGHEVGRLSECLGDVDGLIAAFRTLLARSDREEAARFVIEEAGDFMRINPASREKLLALLKEIRLRLVGDGVGGKGVAQSYVLLARSLAVEPFIVKTFDALEDRKDRTEERSILASAALEQLVESQRYADVVSSIPSLKSETIRTIDQSAMLNAAMRKIAKSRPELAGGGLSFNEPTVKRGGAAFAAFLGAGRAEDAVEVAAHLIDRIPDESTVQTLARRIEACEPVARAEWGKAIDKTSRETRKTLEPLLLASNATGTRASSRPAEKSER